MQVIIFEDENILRFRPLVDLKPVYELVTGCFSLKSRFLSGATGKVNLSWHLRKHIAPWFREVNPGAPVNSLVENDLMLVNGRLVCDERVIQAITDGNIRPGEALVQDGNLLFCRLDADDFLSGAPGFPDLVDSMAIAKSMSCVEVSGFIVLENLWDPVALHPKMMSFDGGSMVSGRIEGQVHPSAVLVNPASISIERGAVVMAGAVLDASSGFIHIGEGAIVEPQAVLMQNVVIAPGARVKIGAKIYSNVFIGTGSKAGGEIEDSIIEPYANKQHDGFLGHSYISSWCNIGAGTDTSDLKNNYSAVSLLVKEVQMQTGLQFLGLLMGEHSKCSIGTTFNTGTVVGTSANIFGSGMPPKYVPSFSWGNGHPGFDPYQVDKAVETARKVMERRRVDMSAAYEEMFRIAAGFDGA
ncbi:MAG TPA: GlmU family protein [Chlorobaculum sp.]|nr:GlmU family protein [Chlorobaculum sp.]